MVLSVIQSYRNENYRENCFQRLSDALNELEKWASEWKMLIENTSSPEEKAELQNSILNQMEAILKVFLLFNTTLRDIDYKGINKICNAGFFLMFNLLDENIQKRLDESLKKTLSQKKLDYSTIEECLKEKHKLLNQPYFGLTYFNSQFFTSDMDVIDVHSNILNSLLYLPYNLIEICQWGVKELEITESVEDYTNIINSGINKAFSPKEKMNYALVIIESILDKISETFYYSHHGQRYIGKEKRQFYSDLFSIIFEILNEDIKMEFKKYFNKPEILQIMDIYTEKEFDTHRENLKSLVVKIKDTSNQMFKILKELNINADIEKDFESHYQKLSTQDIVTEKTLDEYFEDLNILYNKLEEYFCSHIRDVINSHNPLSRQLYEDYITLREFFYAKIQKDFFEMYFEKLNNPQIFKALQCVNLIKSVKFNNSSDDSFSITPMTAYFDSNFLENLLHWGIQPIKKTNDSHYQFSLETQNDGKISNPFIITFDSQNENFINPEKLNILITFRYMPFPDKMYDLVKQALKTKDIKFDEIDRGQTLKISSIKNKVELFSIMEIINHFANFNKIGYAKLDSILGFIDPASKIIELIKLKEYEQVIKEARDAELKGYENYVWHIAEDLYNKYIKDMALEVYNSIDQSSPFYQKAKMKCLYILTELLSVNLSKDEIILYKEYQFEILLEICEFDVGYKKFRDALYAELCGNIVLNPSVCDVEPNLETLLKLAKESCMKEKERKSLKKENNALKNEIEILTNNNTPSPKSTEKQIVCNATTQGFFAHPKTLLQETSINSTTLKELLKSCYNITDLSIIDIKCNNDFLEIKLQNPICFKKTLSKYNNIYYNKNNCSFCMTDENEIFDFIETLKLESQRRCNTEQVSILQNISSDASGLSLK